MSSSPERRRLGDVLVDSGLLTPEQLDLALESQRSAPGPRRRLGQVVADLGLASERDVAECLANLLGLRMVDLSKTAPAPDVVRLLPRQVAERTRVLVLDKGPGGIVVAAADPTNVLALDDVRLHTRTSELTVLVATESQIREQVNKAWSLGQDDSAVAALTEDADDDDHGHSDTSVDDDAPIVRLVNQLLGDAVRMRVSDIHVEVQRDSLRVRYRIDGLLRDMMTAPKRIATSVISRIKIISGLDIAERRVPQDGRTRFVVEGIPIDARVSTLPSLHGEKVVIRLLSRGDAIPRLDELGFEAKQLATFMGALNVPQGLILITGPTGSGKTNTLYSAIAEISKPETNIVTLEDPVEVQLPGITQVGVNIKAGMTFAAGLRSILRQDPDIVLVGETRDTETAELTLKAAMTGHLVLTTLHTNSAVAALTRLVDMGIEPFMVASSLTCAIAQRLVRRPCTNCLEPYIPDDITLAGVGLTRADLANTTLHHGAGCSECGDTGYKGRTAVYEVLVVDAALRQVLLSDPSEAAISAQARASGMSTLRASAVAKALAGLTTLEEAVRVTHSDHTDASACPSCERPVEEGMVACPWCAATLDRGLCRSCAKHLDPDWKICPWCRTRPEHAGPSAAVPQTAVRPPQTQAPQTPATPTQSMHPQAVPPQAVHPQAMPSSSSPVAQGRTGQPSQRSRTSTPGTTPDGSSIPAIRRPVEPQTRELGARTQTSAPELTNHQAPPAARHAAPPAQGSLPSQPQRSAPPVAPPGGSGPSNG